MKTILIVLGLVAALAACGEKPQSGPSARKVDTEPWQAAQDPFVAPGWKPGDRASWEAQMRQRAVDQNEFVRIGPRS
ncbi:MAG: hypothetical protein ACM3PU_13755 [Gemmatimonadota bacterium]